MKGVKIFLLFSLISVISCKNETPGTVYFDRNYAVFGCFYGECAGPNCIEIFKIENGILYEDSSDVYPSDVLFEGDYHPRSQQEYDMVKKLTLYAPPDLLAEPQGNIGAPDSHDQGGIYFELKVNYQRKFWKIDTDTAAIPRYLILLTDSIKAYTKRLQ